MARLDLCDPFGGGGGGGGGSITAESLPIWALGRNNVSLGDQYFGPALERRCRRRRRRCRHCRQRRSDRARSSGAGRRSAQRSDRCALLKAKGARADPKANSAPSPRPARRRPRACAPPPEDRSGARAHSGLWRRRERTIICIQFATVVGVARACLIILITHTRAHMRRAQAQQTRRVNPSAESRRSQLCRRR